MWGTRRAPRSLPISLVLVGLVLAGCLFPGRPFQGPFQGRVVDMETGEPIAGAVMLVKWIEPGFPYGAGFYDAREAVTDATGRFTVPRAPIPGGKLIQSPSFHLFAPGYVDDVGTAAPVTRALVNDDGRVHQRCRVRDAIRVVCGASSLRLLPEGVFRDPPE